MLSPTSAHQTSLRGVVVVAAVMTVSGDWGLTCGLHGGVRVVVVAAAAAIVATAALVAAAAVAVPTLLLTSAVRQCMET